MPVLLRWMGAILVVLPCVAMAQSTLAVTPGDILWENSRQRPGTQFAVIEGYPARQGTFILLAKYPANYEVTPHYHGATGP